MVMSQASKNMQDPAGKAGRCGEGKAKGTTIWGVVYLSEEYWTEE